MGIVDELKIALLVKRPLVASPHAPVSRVVEEMRRRDAHGIVVVQKRLSHEIVLGVFTLGDFQRRVKRRGKKEKLSLEQVMSPNPILITKDSSVREVGRIMREKRISIIPVVESDSRKLLGAVFRNDVELLLRIDELEREGISVDEVVKLFGEGKVNEAIERLQDKLKRKERREKLIRKLKETEQEMELLVKKFARGRIGEEAFKDAMEELKSKKYVLKEEIAEIDSVLYRNDFEKPF